MSRFSVPLVALFVLILCVCVQSVRINAIKKRTQLASRVSQGISFELDESVSLYGTGILVSPAMAYVAHMTDSCNFVVQDFMGYLMNSAPEWQTKSSAAAGSNCYIVPQGDSNLCIYGKNGFVWCTMKLVYTAPHPYKLVLHDDGNLLMLDGSGNTIWSAFTDQLAMSSKLTSGNKLTSRSGRYTATMGTDCDLKIMDTTSNLMVWHSNTSGKNTGCYLIPQTDSNLCVYGSNNGYVWCYTTVESGLTPNSITHLQILDTGILTLYGQTNNVIWAS